MDAGDIWSSTDFEMRVAGKASIYRREVTEAAMRVISDTVRKFQTAGFRPEPLDYSNADVRGTLRPSMKQVERRIDWSRDVQTTSCEKFMPRIALQAFGYDTRRRILSLRRTQRGGVARR